MDTQTFQIIISFVAVVLVPLAILGAFALLAGVDSRDMDSTGTTPTPWI
jgi:hypothetical protein